EQEIKDLENRLNRKGLKFEELFQEQEDPKSRTKKLHYINFSRFIKFNPNTILPDRNQLNFADNVMVVNTKEGKAIQMVGYFKCFKSNKCKFELLIPYGQYKTYETLRLLQKIVDITQFRIKYNKFFNCGKEEDDKVA